MKSIMICLGTVSILLLSGCAPRSTQLSNDTYFIKCSQMFGKMEQCVEQAKKMCPNGYDVVSAQDENTYGTSYGQSTLTPYIGEVKRSMLVKCHTS